MTTLNLLVVKTGLSRICGQDSRGEENLGTSKQILAAGFASRKVDGHKWVNNSPLSLILWQGECMARLSRASSRWDSMRHRASGSVVIVHLPVSAAETWPVSELSLSRRSRDRHLSLQQRHQRLLPVSAADSEAPAWLESLCQHHASAGPTEPCQQPRHTHATPYPTATERRHLSRHAR